MEINTNCNFDAKADHPVVRELTEQEQGLYFSALRARFEVAVDALEGQEQGGEIDPADLDTDAHKEKLRTANVLQDLFEELAVRRALGIMASPELQALYFDRETGSVEGDEA